MIGAARRYRELLTQLLLEREEQGEAWLEADESRFVEELDRCWWAMTNAEQAEVEGAFADEPLANAPVELSFEDVRIERGQKAFPRKAA
jgi:hypothetical protein